MWFMELAKAPDRTCTNHAAGLTPERHAELRLLETAQVTTAEFAANWQALARNASEPNPYLEPWFVLPSLKAFAPERVRFAALYCAGTLAGVLPIAHLPRYYGYPIPHLATWVHANSFCGVPLVLPGHETRFWRALIAQLERHLGSALFLHLPLLPTEGPLYAALIEVLTEQGRTGRVVVREERAMLASGLSAEDYLTASMSAKKRKELRRQHKRLSEEGLLAFERLQGGDGLDQWIDEFLTLESAGWKGEAQSALANAPETRAFFIAALSGAAREGRLERLALRLDGKPIAMLASFHCPPGTYSFKTAFDEGYARFSPGMLLQLENLSLLDRPDIAWADSCATEGHPMIERLWRERRSLVGINLALGGSARRTAFRALLAYETRNRNAP